jgi:hypothetical protein
VRKHAAVLTFSVYFSSKSSGAMNSGVPVEREESPHRIPMEQESMAELCRRGIPLHTDHTLRVGLDHGGGETEVSKLHFSIVTVDKDVVAFQIAMDNGFVSHLAVQIMQSLQDLPAPIPSGLHTHLPVFNKTVWK